MSYWANVSGLGTFDNDDCCDSWFANWVGVDGVRTSIPAATKRDLFERADIGRRVLI